MKPPWAWRPKRPRNTTLIGIALAIATMLVTCVNQRDIGIARDETVYMTAGTRYAEWWVGLVKLQHGPTANIDGTFGGELGGGNNPEHPPLVKLASGLTHRWFHDWLPLCDELTAYRLPSIILHGVLAYLVFAMALALFGLAEAMLAVACLALLPRALFHAGLDCFDAPTMTLWFATIYAYWKCLDARKWPWQAGVVWGLALATKHTALLIPFAIAPHLIVLAIRDRAWLRHWRVVASFALLGPLVLYILWPWLWLAPKAHVQAWLAFHMHHTHYNFEYLGHNWNAPRFPWHVPLVTTLFTVPTATLAAAATGAGVWLSRWRRAEDRDPRAPVLLLVLSAAAAVGPFVLGSTPIFGAEKHFMPMLPTLCIAAGVGATWAARRAAAAFTSRAASRIALGIVATTLVAAGATEVAIAHPYALTWYSALAGGAPGGADLGMNRQFWGVSARGVTGVIAQQPPGLVYSHDAQPAWGWYARLGLLPKGYGDSGHEDAGVRASKYAIVIHELHFNRHDYMIWNAYGTTQPIYVLRADGVPIVSVYKRP